MRSRAVAAPVSLGRRGHSDKGTSSAHLVGTRFPSAGSRPARTETAPGRDGSGACPREPATSAGTSRASRRCTSQCASLSDAASAHLSWGSPGRSPNT
eukprot:scaffold8365_cov267-Pinguiococcus_pyrenoidosus.AAC.1